MATSLSHRPRFREREAKRIALERYGLDATASPLPSERDQNFRLVSAGGEFVLKISAAEERAEVLDLQNRALEWLARRAPEIPVPRVVASRSAEGISTAEGEDGSRHFVRLLTHLPGSLLAEARPRSSELLADLGRLLGRLDRALEGFAHPAAVARDLPWNPERALAVIGENASAIRDPDRRNLVDSLVRLLGPALPAPSATLPRGVIHDDANDWNVLVGPPAAASRRVAGLLDFGDMLETWTVCEPAVAAAYALLESPNPIAAAAAVVGGYHRERPLAESEIAAIFPLIAIRLCVSVCLSARRRTTDPENAYLTVSEEPAWRALERLRDVPPRLAEYVFRRACGLPPCPASPALERWLEKNRGTFGSVVDADLSSAVVFDLSVGSPDVSSPLDAGDTADVTERVFRRIRESGAEAAIGRYDEARLVYSSDAFAGPGGERPERRTVHLGVDVFVAPGTRVLAPLEGKVHSVRDNAARLDYGPTVVLEHRPEGAPPFFTLYGHLSRGSLSGLGEGGAVAKGETIGRVGEPPENGDWPPHVHFQLVTDMLGRRGEFPGVAAASEREIWLSLCPDPSPILGRSVRRVGPGRESLRAERKRLLGPSLSLSYREPLEIVRGSGQFLYDESGAAYLDVVNNVAHVGHAHPRVVAAGARQMGLLNTNTRYLHPAILEYADRLAATLPEPLRVFFFVCSGSEANELALRLARAHTRGEDLVVVEGAYHGNTATLIGVSPYKFDGPGGAGAPPHVWKVPMPDDYRGLYRREDPERGVRFAAHVARAFGESRARGRKPAAFLCESLLSCGGQIVLPSRYLEAAYRHARAEGAVCIADVSDTHARAEPSTAISLLCIMG